jgi:hypothetical protein
MIPEEFKGDYFYIIKNWTEGKRFRAKKCPTSSCDATSGNNSCSTVS